MEIRQSVLEISETAFLYNIEQIQNYVKNDKKIMPVIKANAYGTYINKNIKLIQSFEIVAVAIVEEAVELRKLGFKNEIFILNQPYIEDIENIIKYDLSVGICSIKFIDELGKSIKKENSKKANSKNVSIKKVKIHLELETGMGRTGIYLKDLDEFLNKVNLYSNIKIEGVYTHLSSPDIDKDFTEQQITLFEEGMKKVSQKVGNIKYIHYSASNGILNFKNEKCNFIRPGIIMYGYQSSDKTFEKINLKPVAKLKSKISYVKEVEKGESISYGRTFIAKEKMKIATVGIGYADGIKRALSNIGEVVIKGCKARIIGKICMDSFMIDVTAIKDIKEGDSVYIWDNEKILLEEIANKCNTINYEIISTISDRVPRKFVK